MSADPVINSDVLPRAYADTLRRPYEDVAVVRMAWCRILESLHRHEHDEQTLFAEFSRLCPDFGRWRGGRARKLDVLNYDDL